MHTSQPEASTASMLAALVRDRRLELGLSTSAAARKAGVDRGTWHDIESGSRTNMLPETYNRIDVALEWEPGHLRRLARPFDEPELSQEDQLRRKLISYAGSLSEEQLQRIVSFVDQDVLSSREARSVFISHVKDEDTIADLLIASLKIDRVREEFRRTLGEGSFGEGTYGGAGWVPDAPASGRTEKPQRRKTKRPSNGC